MKLNWFLGLVIRLSGLIKPITLSSFLSILSLTVGVTILLVSMALVDSYEKSFKESIYSVFSHAIIFPSSGARLKLSEISKEIKESYGSDMGISESSKKEGLLAHGGSVAGVILEGVNTQTIDRVIDLKNKVIDGGYEMDGPEVLKKPKVLIGKSLLKKFGLKVGDVFAVVIPQANFDGQAGFSRKIFTYTVGGVLDLGSHDYNKRFIVMDKFHANKAGSKAAGHFSEIRLRFASAEDAQPFKYKLIDEYPDKYWVQTWKDKSGGLLEAIKIERVVIFFLVLILVVVAAFNVSTNLYLNLAKRLKEFSVLQTIGFQKRNVAQFMVLNGLLLAAIGLTLGGLFAKFIVFICNQILKAGLFVPPEVYKLTSISIELSLSKFLIVAAATFLLCFVASLAPAMSVYNLSIVKGLRYD